MREILNTFQLDRLSGIDFPKLEQLPETAGIYFVVDDNKNIWYIGKAQNIKARWIGHHRYAQLNRLNQKNHIKILWYRSENDENILTELEKHFINTYHPILNKTKVEVRQITPAELDLRNTLVKIAKYVIVYGYEGSSEEFGLPSVYLKYDFLHRNPASILRRIFDAVNKRGSLKWSYYRKLKATPIWRAKCNGTCIVVGAGHDINLLMKAAEECTLAGVGLLNISKNDFHKQATGNNMHKDTYHPLIERYTEDIIPLLWTKDFNISQYKIEALKDLSKQRTESKIRPYRPRGKKVKVVCTTIGLGIECIVETYKEAIDWFGGYEALGLRETHNRPYSIRGCKPHKVTVRLPEIEEGITKYKSLSAPISASTKEELIQRFENIKQLSPLHKRVKLES